MMGIGMWSGGYLGMIISWIILAALAIWVINLLFRTNEVSSLNEPVKRKRKQRHEYVDDDEYFVDENDEPIYWDNR